NLDTQLRQRTSVGFAMPYIAGKKGDGVTLGAPLAQHIHEALVRSAAAKMGEDSMNDENVQRFGVLLSLRVVARLQSAPVGLRACPLIKLFGKTRTNGRFLRAQKERVVAPESDRVTMGGKEPEDPAIARPPAIARLESEDSKSAGD